MKPVGHTPQAQLGAELRALREREGLSLRELGARMHRAFGALADYENGVRMPRTHVLAEYEAAFALAPGTLAERRRELSERGSQTCPYKGLEPFSPKDADWFFGREGQADDVLRTLATTRFVAVVGASGSGKSSFVRAGLLARLPVSRTALLAPGPDPLRALAAAASGAGVPIVERDLRLGPEALARALHIDAHGGVALVIDQFEELFTLCPHAHDRRVFIDALLGAWSLPAVTVILAMRADFYGHVTTYPKLAVPVLAHQVLLAAMAPDGLRRAIQAPATACGLELQAGLTDTIIEDLGDQPGTLPLLSHALLETWKRRAGRVLTVAGYREAGGVREAIAQTAERVHQSLSGDEQEIARAIFLRLTDLGDGAEPTRRRADRAELASRAGAVDADDRVLDALVNARLLSVDAHGVDIAHEALLRHWPRLRQWVEADRSGLMTHRRLSEAAREWGALGREPHALYRGARLAAASDWAAANPHAPSSLEHEFLTCSQQATRAELDRARRRTRRAYGVALGLAAAVVGAFALAVWATDQRSVARGNELVAQMQSDEATALALSASATATLSSRPDVSLLLAFQAQRISPRPETRGAVLSALAAARAPGLRTILRGHSATVNTVAFSPDGGLLASAGADRTVRLWDARTHRALGAPLDTTLEDPALVAFSPDSRTVAAIGGDGTVRLWDARSRALTWQAKLSHSGSFDTYRLSFSPDGATLALASNQGAPKHIAVQLRDARSGRQLGTIDTGHRRQILALAFSADSRRLITAGDERTIRYWDVHTRHALGTDAVPGSDSRGGRPWEAVAFTHDAATATADDGMVWDLRQHRRVRRLWKSAVAGTTGDSVTRLEYSPDGRSLLRTTQSSSENPSGVSIARAGAQLWNVDRGTPIGSALIGPPGVFTGADLSRDGHLLVSGAGDGTVRLWDLTAAPSTVHLGKPISSIAFSPDAGTIAVSRASGPIGLLDARRRTAVGPSLPGAVDTALGALRHRVSVADPGKLAFGPDGTLASGGIDGTVRLWSPQAHQPLGAPLGDPRRAIDLRHISSLRPIRALAYSPNGDIVASARGSRAGARGSTVTRLWDERTHELIATLPAIAGAAVTSIAFSPDSTLLAVANDDGTLRVWNHRTLRALGPPTGAHAGPINRVLFSPDGHTLLTAGDDRTVRFWDVNTRQERGDPLGHTSSVEAITLSKDGQTIATGSADGSILLWDTRTHQQLAELMPSQSTLNTDATRVTDVAFSPDGRSLAAAYGRTLRVWDNLLWPGQHQLQAEVCNLVAHDLTPKEQDRYAHGLSYQPICP